LKIGLAILGNEPELILKSRWVAPGLLEKHGFPFTFPNWPTAAKDLVNRSR
jgi:NAD dependent epimerase/dehydratase family enzyme